MLMFQTGVRVGGRSDERISGSPCSLPCPAHLHHHFDGDSVTLDAVDEVIRRYAEMVEAGRDREEGWPESVNVASKIGQVAASWVFAREMRAEATAADMMVCAVCPGLVDTEASRPWFDSASLARAKSPDDAALDVRWLATLPAGTRTPYGELVQYRDVLPWEAGEWRSKFG